MAQQRPPLMLLADEEVQRHRVDELVAVVISAAVLREDVEDQLVPTSDGPGGLDHDVRLVKGLVLDRTDALVVLLDVLATHGDGDAVIATTDQLVVDLLGGEDHAVLVLADRPIVLDRERNGGRATAARD